jgi:hypothetical protein
MDIGAEMRRKIGLSVAAVAAFVLLILGIGVTFNDGGLTSTGGLALVGGIVGFILLMAGVGVWLAR